MEMAYAVIANPNDVAKGGIVHGSLLLIFPERSMADKACEELTRGAVKDGTTSVQSYRVAKVKIEEEQI